MWSAPSITLDINNSGKSTSSPVVSTPHQEGQLGGRFAGQCIWIVWVRHFHLLSLLTQLVFGVVGTAPPPGLDHVGRHDRTVQVRVVDALRVGQVRLG